MRRALIALGLVLSTASVHAQPVRPVSRAVLAWHARNVSALPMLFQVVPGSPFGGSTGGGGTASPIFSDSTFKICDDGDPTKCVMFQASGITTANTRTYTAPNASGTLALLDGGASQTFSSSVRMGNGADLLVGNTNNAALTLATASTPDALLIGVDNVVSNVLVISEYADRTFDFAHPLQTNPTMFLENAAQDTTQHNGIAFYGNQGRAIKALTEGAATSVVRIPVAASAGVGGIITFTAFAADASDQQTLTGVLQYAAVNKAATETCAVPTLTGTALNSVSAGTLTCTYACDTTPANAVDIQFNCTSSLTQTTLDLYWRLDALGASEPLPQ